MEIRFIFDDANHEIIKAIMDKYYPIAQELARKILNKVPFVNPMWCDGDKFNLQRYTHAVFGHFILTGKWHDIDKEARSLPVHLYLESSNAE